MEKNKLPHIPIWDVPADIPIVVAFGGGKNSTALLEIMYLKGIRPAAIIFADTGNENPETYSFIEWYDGILKSRGWSGISVVRYEMQRSRRREGVEYRFPNWVFAPQGVKTQTFVSLLAAHIFRQTYKYQSLGEECLVLRSLPGASLGRHSCSMKWKIEPQKKFIKKTFEGQLVQTWTGIHAGETSRLFKKSGGNQPRDYFIPGEGWTCFPLIDWGVDQGACEELLRRTLGRTPGKSACWFCPYAKPTEVKALDPELYSLGCEIEKQSRMNKGLGRAFEWQGIHEMPEYEQLSLDFRPRQCGCIEL